MVNLNVVVIVSQECKTAQFLEINPNGYGHLNRVALVMEMVPRLIQYRGAIRGLSD